MRLEEVIRQQLKNDPGVMATAGTRIFPVTYPQDSALPVIVYQRTANVPQYTHDGEANVFESRFQISSFATTYAEAKTTSLKVKRALRPFMAGQTSIGGFKIGALFLENEFDLHNPEDVEHLSTFQILQDYLFLHTESEEG